MVRSEKSVELVVCVVVVFVQRVLLTRKQGDLERLETQWLRFWRLGRPASGSGGWKGLHQVLEAGKSYISFWRLGRPASASGSLKKPVM